MSDFKAAETVIVYSADGTATVFTDVEQLTLVAKRSQTLKKNTQKSKQALFALEPREFQIVRDILRDLVPGEMTLHNFVRTLSRYDGDLKALLRRMEKTER